MGLNAAKEAAGQRQDGCGEAAIIDGHDDMQVLLGDFQNFYFHLVFFSVEFDFIGLVFAERGH